MHFLKTISERIPFLIWAIAVSALLHWLVIVLTPLVTAPANISADDSFSFQVNVMSSEKEMASAQPKNIKKTNPEPESQPPPLHDPQTSESSYLPDIKRYYEVHELDVVPEPMIIIEPAYPEVALADGITGIVELEIFIDEMGYVESVRLSTPKSPDMFDQAAIEAFAHQRFSAAEKNGLKVKSRLKLVVNFGYNFNADSP